MCTKGLHLWYLWILSWGDCISVHRCGTPPGFQARSKDQEILEEGGGAGPSLLPRRDHEQGGGAGLSKLDVFCFELSKLFVNSGAMDIVLVTLSSTAVERAIAQCTSRWAMARGHRLNTSIVLAAVYGLSGLFRAVSAVEPITLSPSHSPSLIGHPASVDVKQHERKYSTVGYHSQSRPIISYHGKLCLQSTHPMPPPPFHSQQH